MADSRKQNNYTGKALQDPFFSFFLVAMSGQAGHGGRGKRKKKKKKEKKNVTTKKEQG